MSFKHLRWINILALSGLFFGDLITRLARNDVDHFCDRFSRDRMIAGDHDNFNAGQSTLLHCARYCRSGRIYERDETQKPVGLLGYLWVAELNFVVRLKAFQLFIAKADYSLTVATDRVVDLMKFVHKSFVNLFLFMIQIVGST